MVPFPRWKGLPLSAGLHVVAVSVLATLGTTGAVPSPVPRQPPVFIWFGAPPPPPAPLPLGSREITSLERNQPATRDERATSAELVVPTDFLQPSEEPLEPDPGIPESLAVGSPNGSPFGIPEGAEDGVPKVACPAGSREAFRAESPVGTGTGPVADFDRPPRLVRQTQPIYPTGRFRAEGRGGSSAGDPHRRHRARGGRSRAALDLSPG